jgi:hypothetical protein
VFHRTLAAALSVLILSSCGDSTGSQEDGPGRMKFTYSGYVSGTFDASGTPPVSGAGEFGAAMVNPVSWLTIVAVEDNGTQYGNTVLLRALPRVGSATCAPGSDPIRCDFRWEFWISPTPGAGVTDLSTGYVGTVEVTKLTETRVRGTFSIDAQASSTAHGGPNSRVPMLIVNGSFDVPIIPTGALDGVVFKEFQR